MDDIEKKTEPVSFSEVYYGKIEEISERFCNFEYIDSGGFGDVYKAIDKKLKQYVAIKIIDKKRLAGEEDYERVIREIRTARELNHPNLLKYYEIYENERYIAIVMEYVEGTTFEEKIKKEGKFKEEEIKKYLPEIIEAINYLHRRGIVHRDIKPSNLFITKEGNIKLGDFGIVFIEGEDKLTRTDQTLGTPTYMSPEQIAGKRVTPHTDWYSLGIMIYEMATGSAPFKGTKGEVIKGHLQERIQPLKDNKKLSKLIQGLTIKEKEKRWGYGEVKNYIEEKGLPFLPREKKSIFISIISLIIIILSIIFIPKIFAQEPTSLDFKGKKLRVYSKKKLLFEKEMEREISDARIMNVDKDKEKEIIVAYYLKPEDFENKNMENMIKIADILNENLSLKKTIEINNLVFYKKFQFFSLNYISEMHPLKKIKNNKVFDDKNFYIITRHQYFPCCLYPFLENDFKNFISIQNDGFIRSVCVWEDKIVLIGYANTLLHQLFVAVLKKGNWGTSLGDELNINLLPLVYYYLLGFGSNVENIYYSIIDNSKLKIHIEPASKIFYLENDGNLYGLKKGSAEKTKILLANYSKARININEGEYGKAKEIIEESINLSKEYELYGFTVLFSSLLSEIYYLEGKAVDAIDNCLEYAKKYEGFGEDLYVKAGIFAYLKSDYDKAISLWNEGLPLGSPRLFEVKTFPIYAIILKEDWKKAEEIFSSEAFDGIDIWLKYKNYQKGLMYFLRKNIDEAIKILKSSLDDLNMEDLATFYFLSKVCKGEPDVENFEKYIKNYPKGPLYLQFAGACTKGEWEGAKSLYFQMEKASVHDPGAALIFPVIKKIIKTYPAYFNLKEI